METKVHWTKSKRLNWKNFEITKKENTNKYCIFIFLLRQRKRKNFLFFTITNIEPTIVSRRTKFLTAQRVWSVKITFVSQQFLVLFLHSFCLLFSEFFLRVCVMFHSWIFCIFFLLFYCILCFLLLLPSHFLSLTGVLEYFSAKSFCWSVTKVTHQ